MKSFYVCILHSKTKKSKQHILLQKHAFFNNDNICVVTKKVLEIKCSNWLSMELNKNNAPKMKVSIKDSFSKCKQIPRKLPIWLH